MKLSDLEASVSATDVTSGTRARRTVDLPIEGATANMLAGGWEGRTVPVDVRLLNPGEEAAILQHARAFAIARGVEGPGDGDPLYEMGKQVHRARLACVETASPPDAPVPFFGSEEAMLASSVITLEHIAYLSEFQETFQNLVSPRELALSGPAFLETVKRVAGGDMLPFLQMRPGTRWIFTRTLAEGFVTLPLLRSVSTSVSEEPPTSAADEEAEVALG